MFGKRRSTLAELNRESSRGSAALCWCFLCSRWKAISMLIWLTVFGTRSCFKVHGWRGERECKISATTIKPAICTFDSIIRRDKLVELSLLAIFVDSSCYHARNWTTKLCAIEFQRLMCLETAIAFQALQITLVATITDIKAWKRTINIVETSGNEFHELVSPVAEEKTWNKKLQAQARRYLNGRRSPMPQGAVAIWFHFLVILLRHLRKRQFQSFQRQTSKRPQKSCESMEEADTQPARSELANDELQTTSFGVKAPRNCSERSIFISFRSIP